MPLYEQFVYDVVLFIFFYDVIIYEHTSKASENSVYVELVINVT